jgi:hypothetical protein
MILPGLTQHIEHLCSTYQLCQMTRKELVRKKYGILLLKITECDTLPLVHGLCGSGGTTPFTIRTPAKTYSLLTLTMIDLAINTGSFEIFESLKNLATSIQDLFDNTWLEQASYLQNQFIVFDNGNIGESKHEFKQMCVKYNYGVQAKPTTSYRIPSTSKCNH